MLVAGLGGIGGFGALLAIVRARRSEAIDIAITLRVQRFRHRGFAALLRSVSWPGFPPQSRIIPPAIIGLLWWRRLRLEAGFELAAWGTALLSTLVKAAMRRPRPVAGKDLRVVAAPLGGSSFPSGHVLTYVGTYGFLAYLVHTLVRPRLVRRLAVGAILALLALVGPSRIQQGHHWPTDVTASYFLGLSYVVALAELYRRFKGRQMRRHGEVGR